MADTELSGDRWWRTAKIYELYVDKFADNFRGLTAKLDYFTHLGINTLHILPHYPSPMVDDGYDISNYSNVRPALGTLHDFSEFVAEAHKRGIKIIIDLVLNHVSSEHPWFVEARASKRNRRRDFFVWSDTDAELKSATNAFPDFKPSNWIWNEATQDYYYATFYPEQPDLNWGNLEVLVQILKRVEFWADRGVNGFRLDAIPYLVEKEGTTSHGLPETHLVIKNIRSHLDEKYSGNIGLLGEVATGAQEARKYFGAGDECQMIYHFALAGKMLLALKRGDHRIAAKEVQSSFDIPDGCHWAVFLRNHDDVAMVGLSEDERAELLDFLDPERRYPFSKGDATAIRLGNVFAGDQGRLLEAFKLLYSQPGIPIMYYGDEIGMQNLPLQPDVVDTRKYVRGHFDWSIAEDMLADPNSPLNKIAEVIRRS